MINPFDEPLPRGELDRLRRFARDLAYGALKGYWEPEFFTISAQDHRSKSAAIRDYINTTWDGIQPSLPVMRALGYFSSDDHTCWTITERSFSLLEEHLSSMFISYHRQTSSPVAMYIWSELLRYGYNCFLDVNDLKLGDPWHAYVENAVRQSAISIPVLGPASLQSTYVLQEVEWALEDDKKVIFPILHAGLRPDGLHNTPFARLSDRQIITLQQDISLDLTDAISQLLMALEMLAV